MKSLVFLSLFFIINVYASSFDQFNSVMLENIETVIENNPEHFEAQPTSLGRFPASVVEPVTIGPTDLYNAENLESETLNGKSDL